MTPNATPGDLGLMFGLLIAAIGIIVPIISGAHSAVMKFLGLGCVVAAIAFGYYLYQGAGGERPMPPDHASPEFRWVDVGLRADWAGGDRASTRGTTPRDSVQGTRLCDSSHIGFVATCWENRSLGQPEGVPTDIEVKGAQWCSYKAAPDTLLTKTQDHGLPGKVFVCARVAP